MKKIVEIIDKLKINPLFRMSQSSMELTHSNIWAWLFDILEDKQKFFDLFGSDIKYKTQDCHRELHHMDIIIASNKTYVLKKGKAKGSSVVKVDWDSPTLVIENKTKDLAKTQQLEKYRETINSKSKSPNNNFVIATLFEMPKIEKWSEMPYSKIRDNIKELLDKGSFLKKHKAFISEYINMLNDLVELSLILMRVNSGKYDFLSYDTDTAKLIKNLNNIGLTPSYMKYKYGIMGTEFDKSLKKTYSSLLGTSGIVRKKSSSIVVEEVEVYDFQGKPLVQIDWGIAGTSKQGWIDVAAILSENIRIGVQLQDGIYRRFICDLKGEALDKAEKLRKNGVFFKKDNEKKFGKFSKSKDEFRYQNLRAIDAPEIIKDDGKIKPGKTYEEILEHVKQDLKKAIQAGKELKI